LQDEYGLIINNNERVIQTDRLLKGGRYWVGLGKGILTFPRTEQCIIYSNPWMANTDDKPYKMPQLGVRTSEGLTIYLQAVIHYKLTTSFDDNIKAQQLAKIYSMFGKNWEAFLAPIGEAAIKDIASRHEFADFYKIREQVENEIIAELVPEFELYGIKLTGAHLLNFDFPDPLEEAIQSTENAKQEVAKYNSLAIREQILRDTKISLAQKTKTMMLAEADSIKNATTTQQTGEKNAIEYNWNKYTEILTKLNVFLECFCKY